MGAQLQRIRRVKIGGRIQVQPNKIQEDDEKKMKKCLQSIANLDQQLTMMQAERAATVETLYRLMKTYRVPSLENDQIIAQIVRPMGRGSSKIDPEAFRERVTEEDFMECIRVLKEKAEKVLPGKALAEITEKIPGKLGDETLQIVQKVALA